MGLWWLSFCDPKRPSGTQFLGACIVGGDNIAAAARNAHVFGCNPGGEVMGMEVPGHLAHFVDDAWKKRLLTKAECDAFDEAMIAKQEAAGIR